MLLIKKIDLYIKSFPYGGFYYCYDSQKIYTSKEHSISLEDIKLSNKIYYNFSEFSYIKNLNAKDRLIYLIFIAIKKQPERAIDCLSLITNQNMRHEISQALKNNSKIELLKKL